MGAGFEGILWEADKDGYGSSGTLVDCGGYEGVLVGSKGSDASLFRGAVKQI